MYFWVVSATYRHIMIGRKKEIALLKSAFESPRPELLAIIGRRRVGKTYLVRTFFEGKTDFEMVGLKDGSRTQQLRNFSYSLQEFQRDEAPKKPPKDWLEAFFQLKQYLESKETNGRKKVVFIDELPWIATAKSDFLTGFSYFWNSYASKHPIVVIICGSATAWMIKKIINNKGGLHNRVTQKVALAPFTLAETEAYLQSLNVSFSRYQILQLYMTMGGIPHYLNQVKKGKSAIQNINDICFDPQGLLRTEFENLYSSLFTNPERYEAVVDALAAKWEGLNRTEILTQTNTKDGGGLTMVLKELEQSGFITSYVPFGKKKQNTLYRLTDNYSLFYLKYIKELAPNQKGNWKTLSQTQSWKSWSGYAFENICLQHISKIKGALDILGVHTQEFSFIAKSSEAQEGTQIDLLIDRQDNVISLCEMKFYNEEVTLSKTDADKLRKRRAVFRNITQTKKQIFIVLITTHGLFPNKHSSELIDNVVLMDDLF